MTLVTTRPTESTRDDATTTVPAQRTVTTRPPRTIGPVTTEMPAPAGPRSRASMLATLALILGLGGVFGVLTGVLASVGVGLGLLATFAAIGGIAATSRSHVAGKGDALLGMTLGLGAIVVGALAMTGSLPWLDTDTDYVTRVRDWLDVRMPWLFPSS